MDEYKYDELGMAFGFALFGARMAANLPTEESYRHDRHSTIPRTSSFRSSRKVSWKVEKEDTNIPEEDITQYTEEEKAMFDNFTKAKSAFMDFGGAYDDEDIISGENFAIPDTDVTHYSEEEKRAFEKFTKARSAYLEFGGVYEDDEDVVGYGQNYDIPLDDAPAYAEDEVLQFDLFQKTKSARIQFDGVYGGDDEDEIVGTNSFVHAAHTSPEARMHAQFAALDDFGEEGSYVVVGGGAPAKEHLLHKPSSGLKLSVAMQTKVGGAGGGVAGADPGNAAVQGAGAGVDSESNELDASSSPERLPGSTQAQEAESSGEAESSVGAGSSTAGGDASASSPPPPTSRQGSLVLPLPAIAEGSESQEHSSANTPVQD